MTAAVASPGEVGGVFDDPRPRPELTAALQADFSGLVGQEVEAGLVAASHAVNHAAWARCRWLFEACRSRAGTTVRVESEARAALIAAAALHWSPAMAAARLEFARQVLVRLPALGDGMRDGWLDEDRAAIFVAILRELDDAQAREVLERLLGHAARLTHRELARQVEKAAGDVDPSWYEARRAAAVARARVVARSAPSGAAELSGLDLPEDDALAAYGHVVAVADAVRAAVRARGGDVGKGITEAHTYLRLLSRDLLGADDATVVATLTEELLHRSDPARDDEGPDGSGPADDGDGPDGGGPDGCGPDGDGPDDGGPDGDASDDSGSAGDAPHPGSGLGDDGPGAVGGADGDRSRDAGPGGDVGSGDEFEALAFRAGVAVRLELSTLLGLDRRPGEVPEFGVVAGSTARHIARNRPGAAIRLLLYDPGGHLEHVLTLHPRGGRAARRRSRHRRQVIEVLARTTVLDALDPDDHLGQEATLLRRARAALAAVRPRPPAEHPAHSHADAHRRHPGAELDAWIRSRDRTCRFPGCTRPAMGADLDHTLDWLHGGLSEADNLGPLCEPHHLLKHDPDSGWTLIQPMPGSFVWTSPTGTRHHVEAERHEERPDPRPPADGTMSIPDAVYQPPPRTPPPWTARRNRHGFLTDAARATATRLTRATNPEGARSRYDDDPDF